MKGRQCIALQKVGEIWQRLVKFEKVCKRLHQSVKAGKCLVLVGMEFVCFVISFIFIGC